MKQILLALVGSCFALLNTAHTTQAAETPNIVVILADDLGYGDVQCLNPARGKIKTPNFDRLAKEGMTFTDMHSGSSVCSPTRYGLLTGRYAWRTRLQKSVLDNYVQPLIAADRLTLPAMLKPHGYHSTCIGKWHLGFTIEGVKVEAGKPPDLAKGAMTKDGPITRGFDEFFGFHHSRTMRSVFENDRVTQIVEPVDFLPFSVKHAGNYIADRAKTGKPFFVYLPLNSPHLPLVPSKAWKGKSGLGDYADFVMETDWAVGEVLRALEKAGVEKNTLVIATADNGCSPEAGVAALEKQGHFPSALLRGYKSDIWDGGHRVPFIARWPSKVKAASRSDQLLCLTDLMATFGEIVGAKLPDQAGEDSVSFLPSLLGTDKAPLREAVVHHSIEGKFAIRQGKWKLCLCTGSGGWTPGGDKEPVQLYDVSKDLGETTNVAKANSEVVAKLTALLQKYIADGRSTPGVKQANDVKVEVSP
jgi:arylsulfatase A